MENASQPFTIRVISHNFEEFISNICGRDDTYAICREYGESEGGAHMHVCLWTDTEFKTIKKRLQRSYKGNGNYSLTHLKKSLKQYLMYMAKDCSEQNPWITNQDEYTWEEYLQLWKEYGEKIEKKKLAKCRNASTDKILNEAFDLWNYDGNIYLKEIIGLCIKYNGLAPHPTYLRQILATLEFNEKLEKEDLEEYLSRHYQEFIKLTK